jgi:hypothetical protein
VTHVEQYTLEALGGSLLEDMSDAMELTAQR